MARGDLPRALHELRSVEDVLSEFAPDERSRYALYRGLAELAAGYVPAAHAWLSRARAAREVLSPAEQGRLDAAWCALGLMPGEAGPHRSR